MAKKRKNRVRFARVPSGIDTCRFCAMLASRGAVYLSEDTAGKDIHENCHCTCVPSWGGSAIEGYDPDEYYDRWTHPEIYEGLDSIVANSLACLRVAEKRGFVKYDKPLLSFLKTEEDKRGLVAHAALVRNGRRFRALAEDAPEGFSNIDLEMDGVKYEVKSPDGANPRAVESNLRKAKKQFKKNYPEPIEDVRVIFNGVFYGQEDAFVASELAKRGREHSISEVIHVSKAGNIRGTWKAQTPSTERPGLQTRSSIAHSASSMEEHRSPKPTTEVRSLGGVPSDADSNGSVVEKSFEAKKAKPLYSSTDLDYEAVDALRVPAPESYWKEKQAVAESFGGLFQIADEEWVKYLRSRNSWAVTYGDAAILRADATRTEIAEETIHIRQNVEELYNNLNHDERTPVIEYLAQVELLETAAKEGFSDAEIRLTIHNRDWYYDTLKELGLESYVENTKNTSSWG